jgi:hypothetical protein
MQKVSWRRRYPSNILPQMLKLSLATDASDTHIGGVMQQKSGDQWRPLGFFSRKLTDTESHYSTFDRELLAAHAAIKHFRHFCEGRTFKLLDRSQTTCHCHFSCFSPHFTQTITPLGIHFGI